MSSFLAEIDKQNQLLWSSGFWLEKLCSLEVNFLKTKNGIKWLTYSLLEISNQLEPNKSKLKKKKKRQESKLNKPRPKLNSLLPLKVNKDGDDV